jgi:hypothetical protein
MEDLTKNFDKPPFEYDTPYGKIKVIRNRSEADKVAEIFRLRAELRDVKARLAKYEPSQ